MSGTLSLSLCGSCGSCGVCLLLSLAVLLRPTLFLGYLLSVVSLSTTDTKKSLQAFCRLFVFR